jgi:hypothetical protein
MISRHLGTPGGTDRVPPGPRGSFEIHLPTIAFVPNRMKDLGSWVIGGDPTPLRGHQSALEMDRSGGNRPPDGAVSPARAASEPAEGRWHTACCSGAPGGSSHDVVPNGGRSLR